MRYAILTDIHSNTRALQAVRDHACEHSDALVSLGDTVGYGPHPAEALRTVRRDFHTVIAGNHDHAACGYIDHHRKFNGAAAAGVDHAIASLNADDLHYLRNLPIATAFSDRAFACHGTPDSVMTYILDNLDARQAFDTQEQIFPTRPIGFFGHTHLPVLWQTDGSIPNAQCPEPDTPYILDPNQRYLINPGSVGQPRDRNPHAAYAIYDADRDTVTFHRIPYDIKSTHQDITSAGLPERLGLRLYDGR